MMNEEIILKMTEQFANSGMMTYDDFSKLFKMLSHNEQTSVMDILGNHGIIVVDPGKSRADILDVDIIVDYDVECDDEDISSYFKDQGYDADNEPLMFKKEVKQSNPILCTLIQKGNRQAEQDLCIKNKRLVDKYVIAYQKIYATDLEFEDLEQAGYIGMLTAAHRFIVEKGNAFSTYAVFWIKQAISREIMNCGYAIRIPVHMMERIGKVMMLDRWCEAHDYGMDNRVTYIAQVLELSEEEVKQCYIIKRNMLTSTSLDNPVGEPGDSGSLIEFIEQQDEESVEDVVSSKMLKEQLDDLLSTLTDREKKVLRLRFGLDDGRMRTLEETGREFHVTRERIRQIEAKALRKLRHPSRSRKLVDFLD